MAPTPELFAACTRAVSMLNDLPPVLREEPDIRAVIYADARETDRQEALLDALRAEFFPQTATPALGLPLFETLLRLTVAAPGLSQSQREAAVLGAFRKLRGRMTGAEWELGVSLLLGTNVWSYQEHVPGDASTPAAYVIRITVPFDPTTYDLNRARALIRQITSAHLDLEIVSSVGFPLGTGQLGVDAL